MGYDQRNILVGAANIYVSRADSTTVGFGADKWMQSSSGPNFVTAPVLAGSAPFDGTIKADARWRDVGGTTDGVEVSYEPDFGEVVIDQALDSVKMFKQAMRFSVRTTLAEATLENLLLVWAQSGAPVTSGTTQKVAVAAGELGEDPVERSLLFVGKAPRGLDGTRRERVYHVRRALQVESSAHSLARADATTLPVSFRCMAESGPTFTGDTDTSNRYADIIDRART